MINIRCWPRTSYLRLFNKKAELNEFTWKEEKCLTLQSTLRSSYLPLFTIHLMSWRLVLLYLSRQHGQMEISSSLCHLALLHHWCSCFFILFYLNLNHLHICPSHSYQHNTDKNGKTLTEKVSLKFKSVMNWIDSGGQRSEVKVSEGFRFDQNESGQTSCNAVIPVLHLTKFKYIHIRSNNLLLLFFLNPIETNFPPLLRPGSMKEVCRCPIRHSG